MAPLLFTDIADAGERLVAIQAETREQKAARKGISARLMTDVTKHVPAAPRQLLAARLLMNSEMAGRMTNVCISNVPGPQVPVYMNGARLITSMGMGPLGDRMGLFMAITSYRWHDDFWRNVRAVEHCRTLISLCNAYATILLNSKPLLQPSNQRQRKLKSAGAAKKKVTRKAPTTSSAQKKKTPAKKTAAASKKVSKKAVGKVTRKASKKS